MSSPTTNIIPIVALGVYREVAAKMDPLLAPTPFRMTAILDLTQDPPSVRYSPQNLLTVLYNLHPRPKVFITGAAISQSMTAESIAVWEGYVRESRVEETFVINVSGTVAERQRREMGVLILIKLCEEPPLNGDWMSHIMRRLTERYQ